MCSRLLGECPRELVVSASTPCRVSLIVRGFPVDPIAGRDGVFVLSEWPSTDNEIDCSILLNTSDMEAHWPPPGSLKCGQQLQSIQEFLSSDMTRVFLGGLDANLNEGDLNAFFMESFKFVLQTTLIRDRDTGASRGFGFVGTNNPVAAKASLR